MDLRNTNAKIFDFEGESKKVLGIQNKVASLQNKFKILELLEAKNQIEANITTKELERKLVEERQFLVEFENVDTNKEKIINELESSSTNLTDLLSIIKDEEANSSCEIVESAEKCIAKINCMRKIMLILLANSNPVNTKQAEKFLMISKDLYKDRNLQFYLK